MFGFIWSQPETTASVLSGDVSDYHKRLICGVDEILILFGLHWWSLCITYMCTYVYTHICFSLKTTLCSHLCPSSVSILWIQHRVSWGCLSYCLYGWFFFLYLGFVLHLTVFSRNWSCFTRPSWGALQEIVVTHLGTLCSGFHICFYSTHFKQAMEILLCLAGSVLIDTFPGIRKPLSHMTV